MTTSHLLLGGLTLLVVAGLANAQWHQPTPGTSPSVRSNPAMAYNPVTQRTLLFGGAPAFGTPMRDTWSYDGLTWTALTPAASPTGRAQATMVWDSTRNVAVLYGGGNTSFFGGPSIDQTWEYDGATWTRITTVNSPGGLALHASAYDPIRQKVVVYGGLPNSFFPIDSDQTWEYDGVDWTLVNTATNPGPREGSVMVWDGARILMWGGIDVQGGAQSNDVWAYNGTNWSIVPASGTAPVARSRPTVGFDSARGVMVVYCGADFVNGTLYNETWEFQVANSTWTQVASGTGGNPATPRAGSGIAYDARLARLVMFGGYDQNFNLNDQTWQYGGYRRFGTGCAGVAGVPTLFATVAPTIGSTFQVTMTNLNPASSVAAMFLGTSSTSWPFGSLPADLTGFGLTGCTAWCSADSFILINSVGGIAVWNWVLPANPRLVGTPFFNQGGSIEAGTNPAGLVVSNAGAGVIGL